jgi:hypothetical protein
MEDQIVDKNIKIAYIGGGSKQWARVFMSDLAATEGLSGEIALYDIDLEAARRNALIGGFINQNPATKSHLRYTVCEKIEDALKDATFFHFTCGTTWRVPMFAKYYDWSPEFYLSFQGLQNIAVKDNEYFYIALKDYPDIAFTYPTKFFTLGEELENIMIYV